MYISVIDFKIASTPKCSKVAIKVQYTDQVRLGDERGRLSSFLHQLASSLNLPLWTSFITAWPSRLSHTLQQLFRSSDTSGPRSCKFRQANSNCAPSSLRSPSFCKPLTVNTEMVDYEKPERRLRWTTYAREWVFALSLEPMYCDGYAIAVY